MARCREGRTQGYRRRRPEGTAVYRVLAEHLETFLDRAEGAAGSGLPAFVERELRRFLVPGPGQRLPRSGEVLLIGTLRAEQSFLSDYRDQLGPGR